MGGLLFAENILGYNNFMIFKNLDSGMLRKMKTDGYVTIIMFTNSRKLYT